MAFNFLSPRAPASLLDLAELQRQRPQVQQSDDSMRIAMLGLNQLGQTFAEQQARQQALAIAQAKAAAEAKAEQDRMANEAAKRKIDEAKAAADTARAQSEAGHLSALGAQEQAKADEQGRLNRRAIAEGIVHGMIDEQGKGADLVSMIDRVREHPAFAEFPEEVVPSIAAAQQSRLEGIAKQKRDLAAAVDTMGMKKAESAAEVRLRNAQAAHAYAQAKQTGQPKETKPKDTPQKEVDSLATGDQLLRELDGLREAASRVTLGPIAGRLGSATDTMRNDEDWRRFKTQQLKVVDTLGRAFLGGKLTKDAYLRTKDEILNNTVPNESYEAVLNDLQLEQRANQEDKRRMLGEAGYVVPSSSWSPPKMTPEKRTALLTKLIQDGATPEQAAAQVQMEEQNGRR